MNKKEEFDLAVEAIAIAEEIAPRFSALPPHVTSAVLAQLSSTWLKSFLVQNDKEKTRKIRAEMLQKYGKLIWELTYEKRVGNGD